MSVRPLNLCYVWLSFDNPGPESQSSRQTLIVITVDGAAYHFLMGPLGSLVHERILRISPKQTVAAKKNNAQYSNSIF